jgi:hypothetical protein
MSAAKIKYGEAQKPMRHRDIDILYYNFFIFLVIHLSASLF